MATAKTIIFITKNKNISATFMYEKRKKKIKFAEKLYNFLDKN